MNNTHSESYASNGVFGREGTFNRNIVLNFYMFGLLECIDFFSLRTQFPEICGK